MNQWKYTISKFWFIGISQLFIIKLFKIKKKKNIYNNKILYWFLKYIKYFQIKE
jgi:hypothetical protein